MLLHNVINSDSSARIKESLASPKHTTAALQQAPLNEPEAAGWVLIIRDGEGRAMNG